MRRGQKGFTLIELLVVIAILGILAAVAIPRVLGAIDNGRRTANITNAAVLQSAVARFNLDRDIWPITGTYTTTGGPWRLNIDAGTTPNTFASYLQGGQLPPIRGVTMHTGSPVGTTVETTDTWGMDNTGMVIIVHGTGPTLRWQPTSP